MYTSIEETHSQEQHHLYLHPTEVRQNKHIRFTDLDSRACAHDDTETRILIYKSRKRHRSTRKASSKQASRRRACIMYHLAEHHLDLKPLPGKE